MTRWWLSGLAVLLMWIAYGISPYVALYRLSLAVQAHDAAAVAERVNFRTLRLSLTKQALAAAVDAIAARRDLSARDRAILTEASGALAEPLVESLVTPETLIDLLDDGWPVRAGLARQGESGPEVTGAARDAGKGTDHLGLHAASPAQLFALFRTAEPRGFRGMVVSYPPDRSIENRFRLRLRLRGWTWRVIDLELPTALRERISQRLTGAMQR
ncbi:DUF2939 domain-containing protein [Methylobacterium nonmethylotrophicum]|uniref:DUF2939 domain-containing protein n=1 Tax=Methylobacterium nonmethylotrophicum TaxID=1141884 RepID=A0A4Z0NKM5_9HYPH|nr:DUF2939 domain-containing protein [Methylobacterium nonmethylotrophicum]TGD96944.1 DUF2939 domain-containing protein [Methylobacterium nonmethylotrophicum]